MKEWKDIFQLMEQAERDRIKKNIGFLRQWLNEKPPGLITNEDIEHWLFNQD